MSYFTRIFILFLLIGITSFGQNYQWVNNMTSAKRVAPYLLRHDASGNVYMLHVSAGSAVDTLHATNGDFIHGNHGKSDYHVTKFDPDGNMLWKRQLGSVTSAEQIYNLLVLDDGTSFVLGGMYDETFIDDGIDPLANSLVATGDEDAFFVCYASDGTLETYGKLIYGSGRDRIVASCFNEDKTAIIITGFVRDFNATFNNYPTTVTVSAGTQVGYFAKFDFNGNCQSVQSYYTCTDNLSTPIDVACANNTSIYIAGTYSQNLTFTDSLSNTDNVVNSGNDDIFLLKVNDFGVIDWLESGVSIGDQNVTSIDVDDANNLYMSGSKTDEITFSGEGGLNNTTIPSIGVSEFIVKYKSNGQIAWAINSHNSQDDLLEQIDISGGYIYAAGWITGTAIVNKDTVTSVGSNDFTLTLMDTSGVFYGITSEGGTSSDYGLAICYDEGTGDIYSSGIYVSPVVDVEGNIIYNYSAAKDNTYFTKHCPPVRFVGLDNVYCAGSSASLLTGYPSGGTFSGDGITASTFDPSLLNKGYHTITYTYAGVPVGCTNSYSVAVYVDTLPEITGLSSEFCLNGASEVLTGSPVGGSFEIDAVSRTDFDPSVEGIGTALVEYTYTSPTSGCINTVSQNVSVIDTTDIIFLPLSDVCENDSEFSLAGPASPPGGVFSGTGVSANTFFPTIAGVSAGHVISYAYTDVNGCISVKTQTQAVVAKTSVTFSAIYDVCENNAAVNLNSYVSLTGGTFSGTGVSGTSFYPAIAGTSATPYTINYVYVDGNSCNDTTTQTILVNALPAATVSITDDPVNYGFTTSLQATGTGGSGTGYTYLWSPADSLTDPATTQNPVTKIMLKSTVYTVEVTDDNGCVSSGDNITANVIGGPLNITTNGVSICPGGSGNIEVIPSGGSGNYSYVWDPVTDLDDPAIANPLASGLTASRTYNVTVTDDNTLESKSGSATVTVYSPPAVTASTLSTTLCVGESTTISASAVGSTFNWDNGLGLGEDHIVSPITSTTYTVTATDGNGCTNTDQVMITVNSLPSVSIGADANPLCNGETANLTASGALTYTWDNGLDAGASKAVSPTMTTTYTVTGTDGNGCNDIDQISIVVNSLPVINANATHTEICDGEITTLSATGGDSYTWDDGVTTITNLNVTPSVNTTYYVTGTDISTGCSNIDQISITVNALTALTFNAASPNPVCENGSLSSRLDLLVSPTGGSFSGDGVTNSGAKWYFYPAIAGASAIPHTISYSYTDGNGCTNTISQDITVNALPAITFNPLASVCIDDSGVALSASPIGGTFSGTGVSGTSFNPSVAGVGTSNITYSYTDGNGCTNAASQSITVNALPTVMFVSTINPVCVNSNPFTLASYVSPAGGTFSGTGVNFGSFNPANAGADEIIGHAITYSYTDGNGCTNTDVENIIVYDLTTLTWDIATPASICKNDAEVTLSATPAGGSFSGNGVLSGIFYPGIATAGNTVLTYSYTDGNGCTSTQDHLIDVNAIPTITVTGTATICAGESTTISVTGDALTYSWDNGLGTGTSFNVSPLTTTTYIVTATNIDGCSVTGQVTVTVNSSPTVIASDDVAICSGESTAISVVGTATSYSWSNGPTTTSQSITPVSTTQYIVTGSKAGCTAKDTVVVTVNALPAGITASVNNSVICAGDAIILSASGATTYEWDNGLGTGMIKNDSPTVSTTYTVTGTNAAGCSATDQVSVTVNPLPAVTASGDVGICTGSTTTISVSGNADSYTWNNGLGAGVSFDVSPANSTTYSVIGNLNGCTAADAVTVSVIAEPVISVTADDAQICSGTSTIVHATGGVTYNWDNGLGVGSDKLVSPTSATTYTVTVTDANGCTAVGSVNVDVYFDPVLTVSSDVSEICVGESAVLTASGVNTYSWDNGLGTGFEKTVSPSSTVTYTVTGTDVNGCSTNKSVTIIVNPNPIATITATQSTVTYGGTTQLQGFAAGGSGTGYTYLWAPSTSLADIETTQNPTTTALTTSTIFDLVVSDDKGCSSTLKSKTITVAGGALSVIATGDNICIGDDASISALVSGGSGTFTYNWDPAVGMDDATIASPTITGLSTSQTYSVTVTDAVTAETSIKTVDVIVNALPDVIANGDASVCSGTTTNISVTGTATTYNWDMGLGIGTSFDVSPNYSTIYTVTGEDANGCLSTDIVTITILETPSKPTLGVLGSTEFCEGDSVGLSGPNVAGYIYNWSSGENTRTIYPKVSGDYTLTVTSVDGCISTSSDIVSVNANPNPVAPTIVVNGETTFCSGGSVQLAGPASYSYAWSNGATTQSVDVNFAGQYFLKITDANGCVSGNSDTVIVQVFDTPSKPAAVLIGKSSICFGDSSLIYSPNDALLTYNWSNGETTNQIYVKETGDYTLTVTSADGCSSVSSAPVSLSLSTGPAKPVISSSGNIHLCYTETIDLSAPVGYSYKWSNGETTQSITVSNPGDYYVLVFDGSECSSLPSDTASITVSDLVATTVTDDQVVCGASNVDLSATGGSSYLWSTGETTDIITVSPSTTTTYYVTISDGISCEVVENVTVTIFNSFAVNLGDDFSVCEGDYVYLDAGPGENYLWSNGETTQKIYITPAGTSNYSVTVSGNGCLGQDEIIVSSKPLPTIELGSDKSICQGLGDTINAGIHDSYLWSTGETTPLILVTESGSYNVEVTDNGCSATDVINVSVLDVPSIALETTDATCGESDGSITANVSGGTGTYSYQWSALNQSGIISTEATVSNAPYDVYTVLVSDGNCMNYETGVINNYISYDTIASIGSNTTSICIGDSAMLWATTEAVSYEWAPRESLLTEYYKDTVWVKPTETTTYAFTIKAASCFNTKTVTIEVEQYPVIDLGNDITICEGESVTVDAGIFDSYKWSDGANSRTLTVNNGGSYTVTVTENGCSSNDNISIIENTKPQLSVSSTDTDCGGSSGTLDVVATGGTGVYSYSWQDGTTTSLISNLSKGAYWVTVSDDNCSSIASGTVSEAGAPAVSLTATAVNILYGQASTLSATGASTYVWTETTDMTTVTESSVKVTPSETTTYFVEGTTAGCSTVASIQIAVQSEIPVDLGADRIICNGDNVVLDAGDGSSYLWSTGSTSKTITVGAEGTYSVTVTQAGAKGVDYVDVVVISAPEASVITTNASCGGTDGSAEVQIEPTGTYTYAWSNGESTKVINNIGGGIYTVTVSNGTCESAFIASINEDGGPSLTVNATKTAICLGNSSTITVSGADSYTWQSASTLTEVANDEVNVVPVETTTYVVSGTTGSCTSIEEISIAVKPLPVNNLGTTTFFCAGTSSTIDAGAANSYLWSTGETTRQISVQYPGEYTVTVTKDGCSDSFTTDVIYNESVNIMAATVKPDCSMSNGAISVTLSGGTGAYTYAWEDGSNTLVRTNLVAGVYTIDVNDGNCVSSQAIQLEENGAPIVSISTSKATICNGSSTTLYATGASSYQWLNENDEIISTSASLNVSPTQTSTYIVEGTVDGCTGIEVQKITVNEKPVISVTDLKDSYCSTVGVVAFTGSPVGTMYIDGSLVLDINISDLSLGTHTVTYSYTDPVTSCNASSSQTINVVSGSAVSFQSLDKFICETDNFTPVATPEGGVFYADDQLLSTISLSSYNNGDIFQLTYEYTDGTTGCVSSVSDDVTVYSVPVPDFVFVKEGTEVAFINYAENAETFNWNFSGTGSSTDENPVFNFGASGTYSVSLSVGNTGCSNVSSSSDVVLVGLGIDDPNSTIDVSVSPNPTYGKLTVEYTSASEEIVSIIIVGESGQKVFETEIQKSTNTLTETLDLSGNAKGMYSVIVLSDLGSYIEKIILK